MRVKSRSFTKAFGPEELSTVIAGVDTEVNDFLSNLAINNVLDVRYTLGDNVRDNRQTPRMHYVVTVLYLEA